MDTNTQELKLTLQIPLAVKMQPLQPEHEQAFISKCMETCDNDLSDDENKAWFSAMWQQQIRFQQALQDNPEHLASFLRHVVLEKINAPLFFSTETPFLPSPALEDVVEPIAAELDAADHFFPDAALGVDTWTMLGDLLESTDVRLAGAPALVA